MKYTVRVAYLAIVLVALGSSCDEQSSGQALEADQVADSSADAPDSAMQDTTARDLVQDSTAQELVEDSVHSDAAEDLMGDSMADQVDGLDLPDESEVTDLLDAVDGEVDPLAPSCAPAVADYGVCGGVLGWAPDGQQCRMVSGCDCGADCASFYDTEADCVTSCVCDTSRLVGGGIGGPPVVGAYCDELSVCTTADGAATLTTQFPGAECTPGSGGCDVSCVIARHLSVDAPTRATVCALSLELALSVTCWVWGP